MRFTAMSRFIFGAIFLAIAFCLLGLNGNSSCVTEAIESGPLVAAISGTPFDERTDPIAPVAFTLEEFAARRSRVLEALGDDIAVLYGADAREDYRRPRQDNNFYYLTGEQRTGAALLLDGRAKRATLFLTRVRNEQGAESEQKRTGIERVMSASSFPEAVKSAAEGCKRVHLPLWPGEGNAQARDSFRDFRRNPNSKPPAMPADRRPSRVQDFRAGVLEITGPLEVSDLEKIIDPMRRIKSPAEIAAMRQAGRIGAIAIADAIRATRPGILERELEGVCELAYLRHGAHASAWTTIVASGPNITEFHYFENSRRIEPGDMILIDAGPDYQYYTSDITRVWPSSGPYPDRYRELYDKLLAVHKATVAAVRPGVTYYQLTKVMREAAREQGIEKYIVGGAGHYTGMAPHDVGDMAAPFVPGVVFNVEPLLLISAEGLHIRFEDTVLCTESTPEVLTPLDILPWEADKLLEIRDQKQPSP